MFKDTFSLSSDKMSPISLLTRALKQRKPPTTPKFETKVIRDSNPDFRIHPDPDVRRIFPKNVVDALSCQRQLFRQIWYKLADDCMMRKANKCPKIPYSAMVKKMKQLSGIHTQIRITTKS